MVGDGEWDRERDLDRDRDLEQDRERGWSLWCVGSVSGDALVVAMFWVVVGLVRAGAGCAVTCVDVWSVSEV